MPTLSTPWKDVQIPDGLDEREQLRRLLWLWVCVYSFGYGGRYNERARRCAHLARGLAAGIDVEEVHERIAAGELDG